MIRLNGIPASDGIAIGPAFVLDRRAVQVPRYRVAPEDLEREVERFQGAIRAADAQMQRIREKLRNVGGDQHQLILQAHQLILRDEHLVQQTIQGIRGEGINAEWALSQTVSAIKRVFDSVENDYFRERRSDVVFVADQVMNMLAGRGRPDIHPPTGAVVVANDLSPADTARLYRYQVSAFVTEDGTRTSHTAIMARSLGIPAVVGLRQTAGLVGNGDTLIVDGFRGDLIINPVSDTIRRYQRRSHRRAERARGLHRDRDLPAETMDGVHVRLLANIELPEEIPAALAQGAEGIGLYRTEFLFLGRQDLPLEEDHREDARQVIQHAGRRVVTFRTFDLGADKLPGGRRSDEDNPAMGLRSIRLCLEQKDLFCRQLRGLLLTASEGNMRLMFPMISGLEEFREARAVLDQCIRDLTSEGHAIPRVPLGVMVEMPSAALTADILAREVDFFSIGTNDLTQYTLAIDRGNRHVNHLFRPFHPSVLRLIRYVISAAERSNIPVAVCGEVAGDPLMTQLLLGLGVRELSMNAVSVPLVKRLVRGTTLAESRKLASRVMKLATPEEVERELRLAMEEQAGDTVLHNLGIWDEDTVA